MKDKETLVATMPQEVLDEQQLSREITDIEFQAEAMVIATDDDYAAAGEFGKLLKRKAAEVTSFFKPMKDSAYQAHKAVCDREKAMLTPLRNAEATIKKSMGAYLTEQERKRREAEEEARRAAEEERERKLRPVDQSAVMRLIRASKGQIYIPGIVYREVAKMSFRR